jgi:hypothetical protein
MLAEMAENVQRPSGHGGDRKSSNTMLLDQLDDLDITRMQSSRWQQIASVPEPVEPTGPPRSRLFSSRFCFFLFDLFFRLRFGLGCGSGFVGNVENLRGPAF